MTIYFEATAKTGPFTFSTLWVSNGTTSSTSLVNGISGAILDRGISAIFFDGTNDPSGIPDPDFTNEAPRQVFFLGVNVIREPIGIWVTDGTAGGTHEDNVTGANLNGIFVNNVSDPDIIMFDGEVLFAGEGSGATPLNSLWANFSAIPAVGASLGGLGPQDMTVFNNQVLMAGDDSGGRSDIWVFNGTSVSEIAPTQINGANTALGITPVDFTPFGGEVLFDGFDSSNRNSLWVTNGTAGGTSELVVPTAPSQGLFQDGINPDFTVFNNEVVFEGFDGNGANTNVGLWVTNGTGSGTSEIAQFHNTFGAGPHFIVYNNEVLFEAKDSGGNFGLWAFNGTSVSEITGINGANSGGIFDDNGTAVDPGFALAFGEVVFQGVGTGNNVGLWETDGTTANTVPIPAPTQGSPTDFAPLDITSVPSIPNDFNADGASDMLWRNSDGTLAEWQMSGSAIAGSAAPTSGGNVVTPDSSWSVAGIGDFNDDGDADILWRQNTGALAEWQMNGSTIASSLTPTLQGNAVTPDSSWSVAGIGDFNGAGDDEILWRQNTGALAEWAMQGSTILASVTPLFQGSAVSPDSSWSVAGIGDFNGDGRSDILWRQGSTGALAEWEMNGSTIVSSVTPNSGGTAVSPGSSWSVAGIGDFNGDGNADILWRQSSTGTLAMWLMNGSTITQSLAPTSQGVAVTPDSSWNIVEVGDFNGSYSSDIVWQQSTTGALVEWQMNGSTIVSGNPITSLGTSVAPGSTWSSQAKATDFA